MSLEDLIRQISTFMGLPAVLVAGAAAAALVIARDWRVVLFAYAALTVTLSLLLVQLLPIEWALLQAIVGGLIAVMLFMSARQLSERRRPREPLDLRWPQLASLSSFRLLAVAMAGAAFFIVHSQIGLPGKSDLLRDAMLWLGLMGLMGLALHEEPLHAGLSLLTILGGFTLLLYQLTQAQVIIGLIGGWQLLLGLAISYLMLARGLAPRTPPSIGDGQ